jgi:FkbM family methyltransferase
MKSSINKPKIFAINLLNNHLPGLVGYISAYSLLQRHKKARKDKSTIIEKEMAILPRILKKGDYAIDIGANIGEYTLLLSKIVGATGKVFAFEPIPSTFNKLKSLVKIAKLPNVKLFNIALSNKKQKTIMVIEKTPEKWWNFHAAHISSNKNHHASKNIRKFEVTVNTLDNIFNGCSTLQFIKCDSEGMELFILKGGKKLLHLLKPHILLEVAEDSYKRYGYSQSTLFKFLKQLGYIPVRLEGNKIQHKMRETSCSEITELSRKGACNCFFIQKNKLKNLLAKTK